MAWHTFHHAHGVSRAHPNKKHHHGVTHHGKPGMHKHLPAPARKDAWKHKGQAQGQG